MKRFRLLRTLAGLRRQRDVRCLAIGVFDGLHRGHQAVLSRAVRRAKALGGRAWVLSFDPHPACVLDPVSAPPLLMSTRHKIQRLAELGLGGCVLIRFTRRFAACKPEAFLDQLWTSAPAVKEIFVGGNWRFGRHGRGDAELLRAHARRRRIRISVARPVCWGERAISSTRIRRAVARGRLDVSAAMLGRPFSILGRVVRGRGIGRNLGFRTANLRAENEAHPPAGVYAVWARIGRQTFEAVLNFGVAPTFRAGGHPTAVMELHIPGIRRNLYGREIEVFFIKRLRSERRFHSMRSLSRQIERDITAARIALRRHHFSPQVPPH